MIIISKIHSRCPWGRPFYLAALAAVGVFWGLPQHAQAAAGAALLLGGDKEAYQETLAGFEKNATFAFTSFNLANTATAGANPAKAIKEGDFAAVIVIGSPGLALAAQLPPALPVVYTMVLEPVAMSGRSVYGVEIKISLESQFERLAKMFPNKKRVSIFYHPEASGNEVVRARTLAGKYGLDVIPIAVLNLEELTTALVKVNRQTADFIWMPIDPLLAKPQCFQELVKHALKEEVYLIGFSKYQVKAGALLAFSPDYYDIGAQVAKMAERVLQGKISPGVENPRNTAVFVNPIVQTKVKAEELSRLSDLQFIQ